MMQASKPPAHIALTEFNLILRQDLATFIERSFYELHPGQSLELAPHIELIANKLDAVRRGEIKRLIINVPPRHLKSHCVSVAFVAWMLGHDPSKHIICASYGQDLANEMAALTRTFMASPPLRALFGSILGGRGRVQDGMGRKHRVSEVARQFEINENSYDSGRGNRGYGHSSWVLVTS